MGNDINNFLESVNITQKTLKEMSKNQTYSDIKYDLEKWIDVKKKKL